MKCYNEVTETREENMLALLQIMKMLNKRQRQDFVALFSDLDYELDEMGWRGNETDLINDMLFNHFGMSIDDDFQLKRLTDSILKKGNLELALKTVDII